MTRNHQIALIYFMSSASSRCEHGAQSVIDHTAKPVDERRSKQAGFFRPGESDPSLAKEQQWLAQDYFFGDQVLASTKDAIPEFLRQRVLTVVPTRQEEQTLDGVLDYLLYCYGGNNDRILVVIAPPPPGEKYDRSGDIAVRRGIRVLMQNDFLAAAIRADEAERAGIPSPLPLGKGNTVTAGELLLFYAPPPDMLDFRDLFYIHKSDSDLTNVAEFNPTGYLAAGAMQCPEEFFQVRAARGGRNNEPVHEAIKLLPTWAGQRGLQLYRHLHRLKWPLSGQTFDGPEVIRYALRASGFGIEIASHIGTTGILSDLRINPHGRRVAQVDIPRPCLDKGNDPRKEQVVESLINAFLYTVVQFELELQKPLEQFSPQDYSELNRRLAQHRVEYYIPPESGPNQAVAVRQDTAIPPFSKLEEWGIIDQEGIRRYSGKEFGRRYPSAAVRRD